MSRSAMDPAAPRGAPLYRQATLRLRRHVPPAWRAWLAVTGLLGLSLLLPPTLQSQRYHAFAAPMPLGPVADFANVVSNGAFLVVAVMGAALLGRLHRLREVWPHAERRIPWTLVAGLALTALGSTWYHLHPTDASLLWDRLPMTLTFAAIVVLVWAEPRRLGMPGSPLLPLAAYGVVSMAIWGSTGNLTPYLVLQFGGLALIAWRALARRAHWFPAGAVLGWYGLAKLLEHFDAGIAQLSAHWIAGHPLKHLAAALAAWAILSAYGRDVMRRGSTTPRHLD